MVGWTIRTNGRINKTDAIKIIVYLVRFNTNTKRNFLTYMLTRVPNNKQLT